MSRTHRNKSIVFNNYVMIPFIARAAVGNSESDLDVAQIKFPAKFRVSHTQKFALGLTDDVSLRFRNASQTAWIDPLALMVDGTVTEHLTPALLQQNRIINKGDIIRLLATTDASGVSAAGGVVGYITGYFQEPINLSAPFAESGQSAGQRPQAGYYCILPMFNARQSAAQTIQSEGKIIAPFDCRVQAVGYHVLGHTESTGTITSFLKNATTGNSVTGTLDVDVSEEYILDKNSGTAFSTDAKRNVSRGDVLELHVSTGAADIVPIGALSADVLVWVQGHANVDPNTED